MALILEVLDRRTGEVRLRRRLDGSTVTLGRGYDNDVILDDPYVDAHHAWIGLDETGALVVEDLGSLNALVGPDATRQTRMMVRAGTEVRVGRTRLRFQESGAPVPAALPDVPASGSRVRIPRWVATWWGLLGITAAATGVVAWTTWLGSYGTSTASDTVGGALAFLLIGALWAGIWAVAGRVVVHRFRFLGHLAVVSAVTLAALAYVAVSEWAAFLFPDNAVGSPVEIVVILLLIATLVAGHLALASSMTPRRRWRAAFIATGVLLAIGGIVTLAEDQTFTDVPEFSGTLKPLPTRWLPAGTVEDFGRVAADLRRQVDALAAED